MRGVGGERLLLGLDIICVATMMAVAGAVASSAPAKEVVNVTSVVVGLAQCTNCSSRKNRNAADAALKGLKVAIKCKNGHGEYEETAVGELDESGTFAVRLPIDLRGAAAATADCVARLHSAAGVPCPGQEPSKIVPLSEGTFVAVSGTGTVRNPSSTVECAGANICFPCRHGKHLLFGRKPFFMHRRMKPGPPEFQLPPATPEYGEPMPPPPAPEYGTPAPRCQCYPTAAPGCLCPPSSPPEYGTPLPEYPPSPPEYGTPAPRCQCYPTAAPGCQCPPSSPPEYGTPLPEYPPSPPEYLPPAPEYGTPAAPRCQCSPTPTPEYGTPLPEYPPPAPEYGTPAAPRRCPCSPAPTPEYGTPLPGYPPAAPAYGAPAPGRAHTTPMYGQPAPECPPSAPATPIYTPPAKH